MSAWGLGDVGLSPPTANENLLGDLGPVSLSLRAMVVRLKWRENDVLLCFKSPLGRKAAC